jgi:hypothetical protein
MALWMFIARYGVSDWSVHRGQVGHPSPLPVSLTTPPVTTMRTFATTDATASRWSQGSARCLRSLPGGRYAGTPPADAADALDALDARDAFATSGVTSGVTPT